MAGLEKIETYMMDIGLPYEEVGSNTWLIDDSSNGNPPIIISLVEPVVVIRASVMKVPKAVDGNAALFRELLSLNGSGLAHGAYAIEGDDIVILDTLEYGDMDKSEFEASLDAISIALGEHWPRLSQYAAS